jgi:hypothetical protein
LISIIKPRMIAVCEKEFDITAASATGEVAE